MKLSRLFGFLLAGMAFFPAFVQAAPQINGTLGFIPFSNHATFSGTSLATATSITFAASSGSSVFPAAGEYINTIPATFGGTANEFSASNGFALLGAVKQSASPILINSGTGAITNTIVDFFSFVNDRFQFNLLSGSKGMLGNELTLAGQGILHDATGAFADTAAAFSMITSGGGSAGTISNYSVSFAVAAVPEPETYAMLLAGLGLLGFAAWRRKEIVG